MAEEKKEGATEAGEAPAKGGKKKLIIIIAVVLLLVVGGGVGFMMMSGGEPQEGEHHEEEETEKHYAHLELENFIVNLSETSNFIKIKLMVEYDPAVFEKAEAKGGGHGAGGEGGSTTPPIFEERMPMVRDAIIRVLSSKRAADVLSVEGKDQLKEELIEAINEAIGLEDAPVNNVYFMEFIIQ